MSAVAFSVSIPQQSADKPTFLQDALTLGRAGRPLPYDLRELGRVNGAVYTPFVRVAMLSHAARQRGEELSANEVPPSIYEPLIYFAMRWSEHDWSRVLERGPRHQLSVRMVPRGFSPSYQAAVNPVWATEDLSVLARFGAEKPFDDAAIVAAFPVDSVEAGSDVVAFVSFSSDKLPPGVKRRESVRVGRITSEELAGWR
jgi:hypothetical protein